jgi:hypothetical protein
MSAFPLNILISSTVRIDFRLCILDAREMGDDERRGEKAKVIGFGSEFEPKSVRIRKTKG